MMQNTTILLLYNEISKVLHNKLAYVGIVATSLVCTLIYFSTSRMANINVPNAWEYVGFVMQTGFVDVGLIFITIFSATLISEETNSGTSRMILSAPILRREFYMAKLLIGLLYMIILSTTALVISICLGAISYEFGEVSDFAGTVYEAKEVFVNLLIAFFLSWLPLTAAVLYGIFISAVIQKAGYAIGVAVGTLILIESIKHFIGIGAYIFTTYLASPWSVFREVAQGVDYKWLPDVWHIIAVSLVYCVLTFTFGMVVFLKRDLNN